MSLQFCGVFVMQPLPIAPVVGSADVPVPEKNVGSAPPTDFAPA